MKTYLWFVGFFEYTILQQQNIPFISPVNKLKAGARETIAASPWNLLDFPPSVPLCIKNKKLA